MTDVLAGLHAQQEAIKRALNQAIGCVPNPEATSEVDRDGALWRLQQRLKSLQVQIDAYQRVEVRAR